MLAKVAPDVNEIVIKYEMYLHILYIQRQFI